MNREARMRVYRDAEGIVRHELWIDGRLQSTKPVPFEADELAAITRIGAPVDPLAVKCDQWRPK